MKPTTISALFTLLIASTSARAIQSRDVEYANFTLVGADGVGNYPNYTLSVPEDGSTVAIDNPLVVYSIEPASDDYNCTFIGAEGSVTVVGGTSDVDGPQVQVEVTCPAV